jgi:histone deacetylase 1/2
MDYHNPHAPADTSGANTPVDDDARSLNGDVDEDEGLGMNMDGANDAREYNGVSVADAAAEAATTMARLSKSASPGTAATSTAKLEEASNQSEAGARDDDEMDVDPKDEDVEDESAAPRPSDGPSDTLATPAAADAAAALASPPQSPGLAPATEDVGGIEATTATVPADSAEDVDMAEQIEREKEEGAKETALEDAEGEAATEMMGGGHNVGGGSAV